MIRYDSDKNRFILQVPPQQVGYVMRLPMRRFMQRAAVWVAPATRLNCMKMLETMGGWEWDPEARSVAESAVTGGDTGRIWPHWYRHKDPQPLEHQKKAAALAYAKDAYFLSMEQGTMKTKVAIDVACAHRLHQRIEVCVVICPNCVTRTWEDELAKHCPLPYKVVRGSSAFKGIDVPTESIGFIVVAVESFSQGKTAERMLEWARSHDYMVVVDESHWIKTHNSARTEAVTELGKHAKIRVCMTGTPVTRNLIDLYAQYEFLDTNIIGVGDFYAFRNRYAIMGGFKNKKIVGYDNVDELMGFLQPHTFSITKDQCLDLPPKVYTRRYVDLSKAHRLQYEQLRKNALEPFELPNVLVKMLRCRQLVGGFLPDEAGVAQLRVAMADNAKIQALEAERDVMPGQAIIFCQWKAEIDMIRRMLPPEETLVFTGDVDVDERQKMIHRFQAGGARYFLATVQAGGIGVTLTAAQTVLYYSHSDSYSVRMQSEDRAHRGGTKHTVTYVDLIANDTVDETLLAAHEAKMDLAEFVGGRMRGGDRDFKI